MHEIDNSKYPHVNKSAYPQFCIITGLALMAGSVTLTCVYQTITPFTGIFLYSIIAMTIGGVHHLQTYTTPNLKDIDTTFYVDNDSETE